MSALPIAFNNVLPMRSVSVKYRGKACHASAYPWNGVNALDAAVLAYNNISALRQQLRPDWRIQGQFGGEKKVLKENKTADFISVACLIHTF